MDNQQVTQTQLAWLAGMWDGEGHFSMRRTVLKAYNTPQYSPRVGLTNSNTAMLSEARRILDALGISYFFREHSAGGGFDGSSKQVWQISIETLTHAKALITAIRPYIIGKGFQADCISEFCERRLLLADRKKHNNAARKYQARDFELVRSVYDANGDIRGTSETIAQDAQRAMI